MERLVMAQAVVSEVVSAVASEGAGAMEEASDGRGLILPPGDGMVRPTVPLMEILIP